MIKQKLLKSLVTLLLVPFAFISEITNAQRLDKFGSKSNQIDGHRIPYQKIVTYFGYIEPSSDTNMIKVSSKKYFLYFILTDTAKEIGLRLVSPVPYVVMPDKGDLFSENYFENEKDKKTYFDPSVLIERTASFDIADKLKNDKHFKWLLLGENDDSFELFAQPDGKNHNALLRIVNGSENQEKIITPGLYRISFTTKKGETVKGSYVIQLGAEGIFHKLKLVSTKDELY